MSLLSGLFSGKTKYPWRPSWAKIKREADVHPHSTAERADLFEAFNTGSTEFEVLNWLHATIRLLKPETVLETGACDGLGTIALASACRFNGFGKVHSIEIEKPRCEQLARKIAAEGLSNYVEIHCDDSVEFLKKTNVVFDIGFFDSMCEIRAGEFRTALERNLIRKLGVFHDTSPTRCETMQGWPDKPLHDQYRADLYQLAVDERCSGYYESTLSRGMFAIFVKPTDSAV